MTDKYADFDEAKLFARKNQHCGYRFCPLCGAELQTGEIDGVERVHCVQPGCGFVFYQNPIPAAGAMIVQEGRILLVKRAHPPKIGWWCFPAGFMEWREHPRETAVREVREETGLEIALDDFFEVYSGSDDPRSNAILLLYLAHVTGGELRPGDDASEVQYFDLDKAPPALAFESHIQAWNDYLQRFKRG